MEDIMDGVRGVFACLYLLLGQDIEGRSRTVRLCNYRPATPQE